MSDRWVGNLGLLVGEVGKEMLLLDWRLITEPAELLGETKTSIHGSAIP